MRDVNYGWLIRYLHANGASFFFILVYAHIGRGLYYGSFKSPRVAPWSVGVIMLVLMMAIAFLGYVLPYGQMSLWGVCPFELINISAASDWLVLVPMSTMTRIKALQRIGPHSIDILSILVGSILGDAHAEKRAGSTRVTFSQESHHYAYLLHLWSLLSQAGYSSLIAPVLMARKGVNGSMRQIARFSTFSFTSLNWLQDSFYVDGIKVIPQWIGMYLTPLAIAVWISDDGCTSGYGLKLATNCFTHADQQRLCDLLIELYGIKATTQIAGKDDQ